MTNAVERTVLTSAEKMRAAELQLQFNRELRNSLGFDINITALTTISKSVVEQKFFEVDIFDYLPITVGNGAWSDQITTYRSYTLGGDFETGIVNTGTNNSRLTEADVGYDAVNVPVVDWGRQVSWSLVDLKKAAKAGNWDLVTAKEKARKKEWDLGVQKVAFLGLASNTSVQGLLTQAAVNSNTSLITAYINSLSASGFATLVQGLIDAYRVNNNRTTYPTHFIIPESDWNGLSTPVSSTYPNISMIQYLLESFKLITRNPNFKILPCSYNDKANNSTLFNKNRYVLLNYDADSIRMDIPVPYSNVMQNTLNGYQFTSVGYGEFTGAYAYRPLEVLYFDF